MRVFVGVMMLVAVAVTVYAADVDGTWTGSVSGPQGDFPVTFNFKAEGTTLTGSTLGFDGSPIPIKDGKIDGNMISFSVELDFGGMPLVLQYKGTVAPDHINMSGEAFGMPFEFIVKKMK